MSLLCVYRDTFDFFPRTQVLPEGDTLLRMMQRMVCLPEEFSERGEIRLNGHAVPRDLWGMVKPRAPHITEVTFHCPPAGGGGDDGKNVFALVASIGLTILTAGVASAGWAQMGTWFVGGSASAYALAAGVSLVGSLLLSSLIPPPSLPERQGRKDDPGSASASGNVLSPNTPIPRVVGERKVFPPLAMEPFVYFSGPDEVVEAAYVLAGPHRISSVRVGVAEAESMRDVELEVREGWLGDPLVGLLRRQARTEAVQAELRGHIVQESDSRTLETETGDTGTSLPQPHVLSTRDDPNEHQFHLTFPQGLMKTDAEGVSLRVPIRMRMRMVGDTGWVNLPELHFQASRVGQIRATIRLVWEESPTYTVSAAPGEGWSEARVFSPGQTASPASEDWVADSYFTGVSGDSWVNSGNLGSTAVQYVEMDRYTATLMLDEAVFPRGRYEVEIVRGCAFDRASFSSNGYTFSGSVWDFFGVRGTPGIIAMAKTNVVDTLYVLRSCSVWNEHPLPSRDLAVVAVRARNRQLDSLSCVAGGWVRDWDGTGWNTWVVTDCPAPHLRDIYVGAENVDPVPLDMIDDDTLVEWRQHCIDMGYTCNALLEDQTVDDAARIVASCGYAKPYMSDVWGVTMDRDRTSEAPVQIFTPGNMSGYQWTRAFARLPDGFRVNFPDASRDYNIHQISVFRPGNSNDSGRMEQITYEGLVHEQDVVARAIYDQNQAILRGTFHSFDAAAESVMCRRGSLIGVQHDMMSEYSGSGTIVGIVTDTSGDIVEIVLDSVFPESDAPFMDEVDNLADEENLAVLGMRLLIAIQRQSTVTTHRVSDSDQHTVVFDPPIDPSGIAIGSLVTFGLSERVYRRMIVFGIVPRPNFEARITAVDEAPELWS